MQQYCYTKLVIFTLFCPLFLAPAHGQTIHDVCLTEVAHTGTVCTAEHVHSNSAIFTPTSLTIEEGDQIRFWTRLVNLGGYGGSGPHDIRFAGSAANNVMLAMETDFPWGPTSVLTPPFTSTGNFSMTCANGDHCWLFAELNSGWSCTGYSVTVEPSTALSTPHWQLHATQLEEGTVKLQWKTREQESAEPYLYKVERALLGEDMADAGFEVIDSLRALPSEAMLAFQDKSAPEGTQVSYRVFMQNANGSGEYSNVVTLLGGMEMDGKLKVCPNPTRDYVTLDYTMQSDAPVRIDLLDTQGRLVSSLYDNAREAAGQHIKTLHLPSNLAAQTYIVRAQIGAQLQQQKLVVTP